MTFVAEIAERRTSSTRYEADIEEVVAPASSSSSRWQRISKEPGTWIIILALLGFVVGLLVALYVPVNTAAENESKRIAMSWVQVPGKLYLNALQLVVLPLIFVNILLSVIEMMKAGDVISVAWKTVAIYLTSSVVATTVGLLTVMIFYPLFQVKTSTDVANNAIPGIRLECPSGTSANEKHYLSYNQTTNLFSCDPIAGPGKIGSPDVWEVDDLNKLLVDFDEIKKRRGDFSMSDAIRTGVFLRSVPKNIFQSLAKSDFLGIIFFAALFGVACQQITPKPTVMITLLKEINTTLVRIVVLVIHTTPVAVASLVCYTFGSKGRADLAAIFTNLGVLIMASLVAMIIHMCILYPLVYLAVVRRNPWNYFKQIAPIPMMAFVTGSSAATLPVTIRVVTATREVPARIANFVLSMGCTINMDGSAIYFATVIVFLAVTEGRSAELDFAKYILIILLSTLGSAGSAPVPSSGLVMILIVYNAVFNTTGEPENLSLVIGIIWIMDRFITALNVTGDALTARMVVALCVVEFDNDKDYDDDDVLMSAWKSEPIKRLESPEDQ
eukprot:GEMP01008510.1.p1 GENE.GEMP01008510.1~~GEMP01008510.1.p1  ORF type:complete len:556 (+),score=103.70 GEMP01008510.1:133-1800(+)